MTKGNENNQPKYQKSNKWQKAVSKFRRALVPKTGDMVDSVRVRIKDEKKYLSETATNQMILNNKVQPITKMDLEERKKHRVSYDPKTKSLIDHSGVLANTMGGLPLKDYPTAWLSL